MGCGSSKIMVVRPADHSGCEDSSGKPFSRGDSATSKHTTDSGVGLEAGEGPAPLHRTLPSLSPLTAPSSGSAPTERQASSDIIEQLRNQGILLAPPTVGGAGEAYSVMIDSSDRVLQKPPARLQSLSTKEQTTTSLETIDNKMKSVEERRKVKEADLKQRLRSARLRGNMKLQEEEEEGGAPDMQGAGIETDSTFIKAMPPNEEF
ncbi:stathmin domain-containing protein 1 [Conger conger]|uniref:stathmin domain-containing protein 1 n=1 Tax=Conger conger TaxID=82655 RepID=UPI002A59FA74|nr:stathmin domain-containing protein 1 [Conger conger]